MTTPNNPYLPARYTIGDDVSSYGVARRATRQVDVIRARGHVALSRIETATEEAAAVVQARNALGAAAAQADMMLSGILAALPINDPSDADFRAQLKHSVRANVIADIYRFQP